MPPARRVAKKNIVEALRRHLGQRTVLYVALPILDATAIALRQGAAFAGLVEAEVVMAFRDLAKQFGHSDYHPTYIQRRLGPNGFLEIDGTRYRFRDALTQGITVASLDELGAELRQSLQSAFERRQAVIRQLEDAVGLPQERIQERQHLVDSYLRQIFGNRGEMFEVISFAVLREYFRTFGFSLQRFSTTHANDGGMDFVAAEAIYQVTTDESINKVRKDLAKSPGTKRVLVRPALSDEVVRLCESEVLEAIDVRDLLDHFVGWLLQRDTRMQKAKHLQHVLQIALNEFRRENRAENVRA